MTIRFVVVLSCIAACQSSVPEPPRSERSTAPEMPKPVGAAITVKPPTPASSGERVTVGDISLTLQGCELIVESESGRQTQRVDLPEGCTFGRNPDGAVQIQKTKQGPTVLIISSRPDERRKGDCDTRMRGVVVSGRSAKISTEDNNSASCGAVGPFDEPLFIVLAASAH